MIRKSKKLSLVIMITLLLSLAAGCGGSSNTTSIPQQQQPVEQASSIPESTNQADVSTSNDQSVTPATPAAKSQTAQSTTTSNTVSSTSTAQPNNQGQTVYVTNTGKKYHLDGCRSLSKSKIPISLSEAKAQGYTPCGICNPPQ